MTTVKSRVAWGAIFAGSLVSMALLLLLGSLWAAIDLSMPHKSEQTNPILVSAMSFVAMFFGGWTTSRLAAGEKTGEALFYGICMWSATALQMLYLAINGILILGSGTLLGQAGNEDVFPVSPTTAWWGFFGVLLSLVATLVGVWAGLPRPASAKMRVQTEGALGERPHAPSPT